MSDEPTEPTGEIPEDSEEVSEEIESEEMEVTEPETVGDIPEIGYSDLTGRLVEIAKSITEIDKDLSAHLGVMAEIENRARQHARSVKVSDFFGGENTAFSIRTNMTVGEYLDTLSAHLEESKNFSNMIGTAWLVKNRPNGEKHQQQKDERERLVKSWGNFIGVLSDLGVDTSQFPTLPPMPSLKGKRSSAGTNSKNQQFFRVRDGRKVPYDAGSNSISILSNNIFGVGVGLLRERLRLDNNGTPVDEGKSWSGTTTLNGKTVEWGWDVTEATEQQ